jgi:hypothetical protein
MDKGRLCRISIAISSRWACPPAKHMECTVTSTNESMREFVNFGKT